MRGFKVTYILSDQAVQRLEKITEEYRKQGFDVTPEIFFEKIMVAGSRYSIDENLKYIEYQLGLRKIPKRKESAV